MKLLRLYAALGVALLLSSVAVAAPAANDPCKASDEIAGSVTALPKVAAVLKPGGHLSVLAVGSATMFGPEATLLPGTVTSQAVGGTSAPVPPPAGRPLPADPNNIAFPQQMAEALKAANPGLVVDTVVRGGRGLTAAEMLAIIKQELAPGKYQLVLWQTGTVEAVRNTSPADFAQILAEGAAAIDEAGANLVLIDPQYSRFLQTNSNLDPYNQALQQTAAMPGVELFRRFDLMRSWVNDGQIDLERTARGDRRRTVELLHRCLGAHLARMVTAGARS